MTLPQPPVFIAAKHEPAREPVDSVLRRRFDRHRGDERPVELLTQKKSNCVGHPVRSVEPADGNLGVSHVPRLQTLSAKGLRPTLPR